MTEALIQARRDFWTFMTGRDGTITTYRDSNAWCPMPGGDKVILVFGIEDDGSSVFLRGQLNAKVDTAGPVLRPHETILRKRLILPFEAEKDVGQGRYFRKRTRLSFPIRSKWSDIADWFERSRLTFQTVLSETLGDTP